jgi:hypothetical protein
MDHMQHVGFMQGGMQHETAKGVKLDAKDRRCDTHDHAARCGPMNLPANTSHMKMAQPPDLAVDDCECRMAAGVSRKLVDAAGARCRGGAASTCVLEREPLGFSVPEQGRTHFGAGGELTDWAQVPGFGYRVEKSDRIRIETMIHNPTPNSYSQGLSWKSPFRIWMTASPSPVKNFYPAWMDVGQLRTAPDTTLPAGTEQKGRNGAGEVRRSTARSRRAICTTYAKQSWCWRIRGAKSAVATLIAKTEPPSTASLVGMPWWSCSFQIYPQAGRPMRPAKAGDRLTISAHIQQHIGEALLRDGGTGKLGSGLFCAE